MKSLVDKTLSRLYGKFPTLLRRWEKRAEFLTFDETFWAKPPEDPFEANVALITTGGVHMKGDVPFDMSDKDGDPTSREIPSSATRDELTITHDYYDVRDAIKDVGTVFPLHTLIEMEGSGEIGRVNSRHYSFMGHVTGRHIQTLVNNSAPGVAASLVEDGVEAVILSPA